MLHRILAGLTISGLFAFGALGVQAQVVKEAFDYPAGNLVGQGSPAWSITGTNSASPIQVSAGSLSYTGITGASGGKVTVTNGSNYQDAGLDYTTTVNDGESIYASAIVNVTATTGAGDYFMHFSPAGSSAVDFRGRLFVKPGASAGTAQFGIVFRNASSADIVWAPTSYALNTPVFLVIAYNKVAGADNDTVALWINPTLNQTSAPAATVSAPNNYAEVSAPNRIGLRQGNTGTLTAEVDELRVDKSWAQVTTSALDSGGAPDPNIFTPGSATFDVIAPTATDDQAVTVTNTGATLPLSVLAGTTVTGTQASKFSILSGVPQSVAANGRGFINLRFTPAGVLGLTTATLNVASNDADAPVSSVLLNARTAPELPFLDSFAYTPGNVVFGSNHAIELIPFTTGRTATVVATASDSGASLSHDGLPASMGNRLEIGGANPGDDLYYQFQGGVSSGSLYASMLLKVTAAPLLTSTQTTTLLGFNKLSGGTNYTQGNLRILAGTAAGKYRLGTSVGRSFLADIAKTADLNVGTTYFVVLRYEIVEGTGNDKIHLYVNPDPTQATEGSGAIEALHYTWTGSGDYDMGTDALTGLRILQDGFSGNWTAELDELRVGYNYNQVITPVNAARHWDLLD